MSKNTKNIIIVILIVLLAISIYFLSKRNNPIDSSDPNVNNGVTSNGEVDENTNSSENSNQNPEQVITQGEIKKLDLEIDFNDIDKEIEVEYKAENNSIHAKVEDEINNLYLSGDEAEEYVVKNFLSINYNNPESDIIDKILEVLKINEDFSKLEIEVDYFDGTKKEIKIVQ